MRIIAVLILAALISGCGGTAPTAPSLGAAASLAAGSPCAEASASSTQSDDWVTFNHDQLHSGCESQSTGISSANVSQLHKVWEFSQSNQIFANPIAVNGTVYVATLQAGTVFALNAGTGAEEWSAVIGSGPGGEIRQTPVYDDGLLFVGIHGFGPETAAGTFPPLPSSIFALRASTGQIVWSAALQGDVRASPAVVNGDVFVPVAGGDPPFCLQGGISAFNETNGQPLWTYFVDPTSADGGSVWSPVAYDGSQLIFGTGNTCVQTPLSANAVVSLNPANGAVNWDVNTAPQLTDSDVGGGALIVDGMVVILGKNGIIYYLDERTGAVLHQVQTGVANMAAGFATASTDGSTIIIGTGPVSSGASSQRGDEDPTHFFGSVRSDATAGGGRLIALDLTGKVKWTLSTQSVVHTSVAITGGVAFATVNNAVEAISIATGQTLWSYPLPAGVLASPIVVPSGVYAADLAGNVYKFAL